jgi:hypothetical protein
MLQWLRSVGHGRPTRSGDSILVVNYLNLRRAVGWLGALLPVILLAANPIALRLEHSSCGWLPDSVSSYYYSPVRNVFVGALCALGLFLIAYVGADLGDRVITDLAGVFALTVAFFPTTPGTSSPPSATCETVAQVSARQQVIGDIHAVASVLFFLMLAWMAILASELAAIITNFLPASLRPAFPWLFLYEAVGIFAFGVSWFVEGQTLSEPEAELVRARGRDATARSA